MSLRTKITELAHTAFKPKSGTSFSNWILAIFAVSAVLPSGVASANTLLVKAALERTLVNVTYDGSYVSLAYPNGDVADEKGVCTDVVIRSYRQLGIDLQRLVHEDMSANFNVYPKTWGHTSPDSNIDHRRVPNLETFFKRHGTVLPLSKNASDYKPGDIVTWRLAGGLPHIGIVSIHFAAGTDRPMIIHNIGRGPRHEDVLFHYALYGHYRYGD